VSFVSFSLSFVQSFVRSFVHTCARVFVAAPCHQGRTEPVTGDRPVRSSPVESGGVRWSPVHFAVRLTEVVAVVSAAVVRRARVRVQVGPDAARLATHVRHPDVRDGVVGEELGLVRGVRADLVRGFLGGPVEKNRRQ
jgi:hypothetical protein